MPLQNAPRSRLLDRTTTTWGSGGFEAAADVRGASRRLWFRRRAHPKRLYSLQTESPCRQQSTKGLHFLNTSDFERDSVVVWRCGGRLRYLPFRSPEV